MNLYVKQEEIAHSELPTRLLAVFGQFCGVFAALAVFGNDLYYFCEYGVTPSVALFLLAFLLAFLPGAWGLAVVIALIPLTAGLPALIKGLWDISVLAMPNPGLDLVAGLFLGYCTLGVWKALIQREKGSRRSTFFMGAKIWPVGLVLLMITASALLAIARNLYLSATSTSLKGLLFNFIHFRPIDWRADYLPLGNWVAYAIAGLLIFFVAQSLKKIPIEQRNKWIFRPLMVGLSISAIVGLIQAATGFGLPLSQLEFRKDALGFAALGLQPDLHAYAAHMLLGVVGLWGYFFVCKGRVEKGFIAIVFILCVAGLVASKSRASLVIALLVLLIFALIYFYRHSKKYFLISIAVAIGLIILIIVGAKSFTGLGWVGDLLSQMQSRRLDSLSDLGGMMGSRFEIWSAVINMFSAYPLMGVGEGEFYRLSSNISFARSEFLQLNKGENAHNYFLQVLAENGLVGIAVFALAFILPFRAIQEKFLALPAAIGIIGLFLGNIFAHSFLVRENLLLGAILLGLLYALKNQSSEEYAINQACKVSPIAKRATSLVFGLSILLALGAAWEIYSSFGHQPFKAGADCFVKELPLYKDGWTSGAWGERFPKGAKEVELTMIPHRQQLDKRPLSVRVDILSWEAGRGNVPISTVNHEWKMDEASTLRLELPKAYYDSLNLITVNLVLSSCYTPRNLGINTDGRRLGVEIQRREFR
jgi:hypothetical protein